MRYIVKILVLILFVSGCSSVKQGFRNFSAYYNTFYNTKQYYDDGLRLNQRQAPTLNPNQTIRIHLSPSNAGLNEFQSAIEAGSSILRDHERSKYLLPSIFIIGKSYYYRAEYFSALEKFQELEALSEGRMRQEAILWQGLTYLEISNYEEGIERLENEIEVISDWNPEILAEIRAVLAELNSQIGEYRNTVEYLEQAIPSLNDQEKITRSFFLMGQSLERLDLLQQALYPYRAITDYRSSFEIEYHAKKKEAEISRTLGNYDHAERIFRRLSRDSKYQTYHNELRYEIARTQQLRGNYVEAMNGYNQVIDDRYQSPQPVTLVKTYYGIGEIYRDYFMDYSMAANYFERSANQRVDIALLPLGFDANELASSFGRYAGLKAQISENDSLLVLANMSDDELKNFLVELQELEQMRFEEDARLLRREQGRVTMPADSDETIDITAESEFGFLNNLNRSRQVEASLQFQAIWGDRPLADDWRRRDAVIGSRFDKVVIRGESDEEIDMEQAETESSIRNIIELSHIPFSEDEQLSVRRENENLNYQLGNVFFLTLNMPDSARVYYEKVIDSRLESSLVTMAMYSMAELELSAGNEPEARNWFDALIEYNPGSSYTSQLASRLNIEFDAPEEQEDYSVAARYSELMRNEQNLSPVNRAERILEIAEVEESESGRARLFLDAAHEYMRAAQLNMGSSDLIQNWIIAQDRFERERALFEQRRDSSQVMLLDTTLTDSEREYWLSIQESDLPQPDFTSAFPYRGAYWDSTRAILGKIEDQYASATPMISRVRALNRELQFPEEVESPILSDDPIAEASPSERTEETVQPEVIRLPPTESEETPPPAPPIIAESEEAPPPVTAEREEVAPPAPPVTIEREEITPPAPPVTAAREETPTPVPPVTAEREFVESYTIVLYSFSNEQAARSTADELITYGDTIFICPRVIDDSTFFRVSVGSFEEIVPAIQKSRILEEPYRTNNFISSTNSACEITFLSE